MKMEQHKASQVQLVPLWSVNTDSLTMCLPSVSVALDSAHPSERQWCPTRQLYCVSQCTSHLHSICVFFNRTYVRVIARDLFGTFLFCLHKHWAIKHFLQLTANRLLQFTVELEWISTVIKDLVPITFLCSGCFHLMLDSFESGLYFVSYLTTLNHIIGYVVSTGVWLSITNLVGHGRQYLLPTFAWSKFDSRLKPGTY
jgi:hypothetical protein